MVYQPSLLLIQSSIQGRKSIVSLSAPDELDWRHRHSSLVLHQKEYEFLLYYVPVSPAGLAEEMLTAPKELLTSLSAASMRGLR